jgi:hypothetical protein
LHKLKLRLENLIEDQKQDKISLCFGSKKLVTIQIPPAFGKKGGISIDS